MKRIVTEIFSFTLALALTACGATEESNPQPMDLPAPSLPVEAQSSAERDSPSVSVSEETAGEKQNEAVRKIQITTEEGNEMIFQLNNSPAAKSFYQQLPLYMMVEDYAGSEKIFYPPENLNTSNTPIAQGPAGTLAYYAPWGNVAIFYGECGGGSGLYGLGEIVSGEEFIREMSGEIYIEADSAASTLAPLVKPENIPAQQTQPSVPSSEESLVTQGTEREIISEESEAMQMKVQVGNTTFSASLENNGAVKAFVELMKEAPVVVHMSDYSGFEKVGSLGASLPSSNKQTTTHSGDIVLYNGNQIVIFYGSNSWSYTRLGKIDDLTGWTEALGSGDVTVTFSVS